MKRFYFLLTGAIISLSGIQAQTLQEGEPALVYYSPKTTLIFDFSYTETKHTAGKYAAYAEELLNISDAIQENETNYQLGEVRTLTRTDVDLSRPHKIAAENGVALQLLRINESGLLTGYNTTAQPAKKRNRENGGTKCHKQSPSLRYVTEEILEAKNIEEEAQAVAKQIFRIRETRMYLLSGEVEHAPADGEAMRLVLEELNKQEHYLTELFTGKSESVTKHKRIEYYPHGENIRQYNNVYYFSSENGFTDAENIDAEKISIHADFTRQRVQPCIDTKAKKSKKATTPSPIVYNIPGYASIRIEYKGEPILTKTIPVAQLGTDMPLPRELFTGNKLPVIEFSEKTGNIITMSKE